VNTCSECGLPRPDRTRPCPNKQCSLSVSYGEFMAAYLARLAAEHPHTARPLAELAALQDGGQ
jgi:hypothetical protein